MRRVIALHLVRSVFYTATFAGALLGAVGLHGGTPVFRRLGARITNEALSERFAGRIVVHDVRMLSIGTVGAARIGDVSITDPAGARTIHARDVEGRIDLVTLVSSIAGGGGLIVDIADARIGDVEVVLDTDGHGELGIAKTFAKRLAPAPPGAEAPKSKTPPRPPIVHIRRATIGHAHVHGNITSPPLDGDADGLTTRLDLADDVVRLAVDEGRATLRAPRAGPQKAPIAGTVHGNLDVTLENATLKGEADLVGACAEVPIVAHVSIDRNEARATVDIARTDPSVLAAALADVPIRAPVELHASAHGTLPRLDLEARATIGASNVDARGELYLRASRAFKLDIASEHVDAQAFGAALPTDVGGRIHLEGVLGASGVSGGPEGTFRVDTNAGRVDTVAIPPAVIEGRFEPKRTTATLRASERGLDASGKVVIDAESKLATFDLQARSPALGKIARARGTGIDGAASARAEGTVDLRDGTLHARVRASGDAIAAAGMFGAKHVEASGTLTGPLGAPVLDTTFNGVDMELRAKDKTPLVYPQAKGRATIAFAPSPHVLDASLELAADGAPGAVAASARQVRFNAGAIEASGLRVTGLGEPIELDVRGAGDTWSVRAKSAGLDLRRASRITGIKQLGLLPEGTQAVVDVDVRQGGAGADGHVDLVVRSEKALATGAVVAEAHATIDRGNLVGSARISAAGLGQLEVTNAELRIPGRLDARAIERATGTAELRGTLDLAQGAAMFAGENVERVAGTLAFEGRVERGDPTALPTMRATVRTSGLEVVITDVDGPGPPKTTTIAGVDLLAHVAWDGRTEDAEVMLMSWDQHGLLGTAGAKSRVPLAAWATGAKRLDASAIGALDLDAALDIPTRQLAELPSFLGAGGFRGSLDGRVRVKGTVAHPDVMVSAHGVGLRERRPPTRTQTSSFNPLDGTLEARWDGERAAITFALEEKPRQRRAPTAPRTTASAAVLTARRERPAKKEPGHLRGLVLVSDFRMTDLLEGRAVATLPWSGSGEIEVENLTLAALPLPGALTGALSGRARMKDLNRDPSFHAKLRVDGFGAAGAKVQSLDVDIGGRDASLFAHASVVDDTATSPSKGVFQIASQALRIKGLAASWDANASTRIDYAVQNGRLALVAPIVKRWVSELDGRVDGTGSIVFDAGSQVFDGGLALHEVNAYVNALGEELNGVGATARFERSGSWKIDDAKGKLGTGEFQARAQGRMRGLTFVEATARLVAPKDALPLSAEGANFAEATGEVELVATLADEQSPLVVTINVPKANVQLPDRGAQKLEPLEADPTIAIGVRQRSGELEPLARRRAGGGLSSPASAPVSAQPAERRPTRLTVTLGSEVTLEGRGLNVSLGGKTLIDLAEELRATGRIELRGGSIEVHGRRFVVDHGTVTFLEDGSPSNPTVVAAAYWDAPDRTRVWVEFVGPLKTGKLTLRSEPAYSKTEILSILLFGQPDPNMATAGAAADKSGEASGATAIGTGFVAGDLNRMLSELDDNLDVETDTLGGNRTRTKLGRSFLDRRLKVQVGYAPGSTYREPDTTFVFLNWQFIPKWSIVATRGDRGTSILDVLFQHRY